MTSSGRILPAIRPDGQTPEEGDAAALTQHQQIGVAGDDQIGLCRDCQGQHRVVVRVAADRFRQLWWINHFRQPPHPGNKSVRSKLACAKRGLKLRPSKNLREFR